MSRGFLDEEKLLNDYQPLIKAVCKKFNNYFTNNEDKMELYNQVLYEFNRLVVGYDPRRGVDFPCYIKRMLNQRVYHYVTKMIKKVINVEVKQGDIIDTVEIDPSIEREFEYIECINSIDPNLTLGKKHSRLLQDVLFKKKTLEEIAQKEGVDIKIIRMRLHFLCKRLREYSEKMEKEWGDI